MKYQLYPKSFLFQALASLGLFLFFAECGQAQSFPSCEARYKEPIFSSVQVFRDVVYSKDAPKLIAASLGLEGLVDRDLHMDIYMPPPSDTVSKRPVVILAHGGGFVDVAFMGGTLLVGTKDNEDVQAMADSFARRGFVTASIEYRTGFDVLSTRSIVRAVWRGSQDMSAAIRFFRKNATLFGIDPERVFIGGSSAGAFASLHATFVDYTERVPESYDQNIGMGDLGALHSRPVVELTGFNPFTGDNVLGNDVDSLANGLVAFWGAIADTGFFQGPNTAPVLMFHGTDDAIVDAECARPFSGLIFVAPITCGSVVMDTALQRFPNIPHQTQIEQGEGHEYWGVLNGNWTSTGPNAFWRPMIDQTGDFFYDIMRPNPPSLTGPSTALTETVLNYSITNPDPTKEYCWRVDNGVLVSPPAPGASSVQVRFYAGARQGKVFVQARDRAEVYSISDFIEVQLNTPSSIAEQQAEAWRVQLAPNPCQEQLHLHIEQGYTSNLQLELFDMLGRQQGLWHSGQQGQGARIDLPVAQLASGLYILRLRNAQGELLQTLKFQKN